MIIDSETLRATEQAVEALVRLDEQVGLIGPALPEVLRLRSAQAILATNERPAVFGDSPEPTTAEGSLPVGADAFAALLGWRFAPVAREFLTDDPVLRRVALAVDTAVQEIGRGAALTTQVVESAMQAGGFDDEQLPDVHDATLSVAHRERWSPLLIAADLAAGAPGRLPSLAADLLRALAAVSAGWTSDVFVVAPPANTMVDALYAIAVEAHAMQRRVKRYGESGVQIEGTCATFGRGAFTAVAVARAFVARPALTIADAAHLVDCSAPTAGKAMDRLEAAGVVREITNRGRDRVFVYAPAIALCG